MKQLSFNFRRVEDPLARRLAQIANGADVADVETAATADARVPASLQARPLMPQAAQGHAQGPAEGARS